MDGVYGKEFLDDKENAEIEQSLALEETSRNASKYLRHEGTLAAGDMASYRQRRKDAQKQIREVIGDTRFEGYVAATANHRSEQDQQFSRMASAQMSHGLEVANKNQQESESNTLIEQHTLESSATIMEQADAGDKAATDLNNKLDWVKTTREAMYRQIDLDGSLDEEQKKTKKEAVDIAVAAQNTAYGLASQVEMKEIFGRRKETAVKQCAALKKATDDCFKRQYAFRKQMGGDHEACYADAMAASRNFALRYFRERLARGNIDEVMTQLTYFNAMSDAAFKESCVVKDKNGKPILDKDGNRTFNSDLGVSDPSNLLWCRREDFKAIEVSAMNAIQKAKVYAELKGARETENFKLIDADIRVRADKLSTEPVLDVAKMQELVKATDDLLAAGYADADKTSHYITSIINSAARKYDKAQKDAAKLQTIEDFDEELKKYNEYENTAAALAVYAPGSNGERIAVSKMVDGQNRMIILINNGISRGILPAERWGKIRDDIQLKRAREDKTAAHMALARLGIDLQNADQTLTEALRDELTKRGPVMQEIAPGIDFAGHDDERDARQMRVRNANTLIYSWSDPTTGRKYAMSGEEYNDLLSVVAKWQERHVNPSPTGEFPEELKNFILATLRNSRTQKTIKTMWGFGSDDVYGINGIASVGLVEIERYFNPTTVDEKGRKVYDTKARYDRDMRALEAATLNTEMPSLETLRRIVTTQTGVE